MADIKIPENIVDFIQYLLPERSSFFEKIEKECEKEYIPLVKPEVGQFLQVLLGIKQAKRILEIGTGIGYSALCMAMASRCEDRHITTIEIDKDRYERACSYFEEADVSSIITPYYGDANEIIPKLNDTFDFIFIDAAKGQYPEYFNKIWSLLEPGGVLVIDNVLLNGWVIDMYWPERRKKTMVCRVRDLLETLKDHSELLTSIIPLGDGVSVSVRKIE
ncbi:MAG: O-methyltransferase [Clostridia bacterium]|nr:O-methyltransferase [Clostridia bacterium]MDD4049166.1 O-methyltransferase [Clostridia bacterium]